MSTLTNELGTTQPASVRPLAAADSDPSMNEALRRTRRIDALDKATRAAASHVRRPAMTS
ncbi:hypothetical protein ACFVYT_24835 [Streptomyces sp. NPDC058290]|uniref:hypothetical protein n=1 Tax=Streptomyces sp. NPDC058290 TaxID=3346426 RepID=UPI0036EF9251